MEEDYADKMKELQQQFDAEKQNKANLEKELAAAKEELEMTEFRYPVEVAELREQIE